MTTPALANESHDHGAGSGSTGGGATVNTRTASATIAASDGFVTVYPKCEANEVPVNGYWRVDGEDPEGNPKVIFRTNRTGEQSDGFRVEAANASGFALSPAFPGPTAPVDSAPITVTAYARCLVVKS